MELELLRDGSKKDKKQRKRMKAIYSKVRTQMEFYFSDSNLQKDKFMKKQIEQAEEGYVHLAIFMKFNRVKSLVDNAGDLRKALKKSSILQVSEDGLQVKRISAISDAKDVDQRTVYVECLPIDADHDWIRRIFSPCGKITYISLPKFKSTGENKRFGFVEFETAESAEKACEDLHNPPAHLGEKPCKFPKSNHQMDQLKRKLGNKDETAETVSEVCSNDKLIPMLEIPPDNEKKKRKRKHFSGSSIDGFDDKSCSEQLLSLSDIRQKRHRQTSESSVDGECGMAKYKKIDSSNSEQLDAFDKSEQAESTSEKPKSETGSAKKKKKKRQSRSSLEKPVEEPDSETVEDKKDKKRKRQSLESVENMVPPSKVPKIVTNESENNQKKKKCRKRKKQKEKEVPEIKVIPKKVWLIYRDEYLALQKQSMSKLKNALKAIQESKKEENSKAKSMECQGEGRPIIEFIPDVIIKVTSSDQMERKQLKKDIGSDIDIAYIDVIEGSKNGVVRCKNSESARRLTDVASSKYKFIMLKGDEEKAYWDKLAADREAKFSSKNKQKIKGSQKLIARAQKTRQQLVVERTHIKFDD